jgi:hypothetical protein
MSESFETEILYTLASYTIGFQKEVTDERYGRNMTPCGSGVLVQIGPIKGVLTAAHVLIELQKARTAGIFTVKPGRERAPSIEFSTERMRCLTQGGANAEGPDLGIVRLPLEVEQYLTAEHLFYNFDIRNSNAAGQKESPLSYEILAGVVSEKSQLKSITNVSRVDTHSMDIVGGRSSNLVEANDGFDYFEFEAHHNQNVFKTEYLWWVER